MLLDPNVPFRPARAPLFYGWIILGLGCLGVIASIPGQTIGVGAFTDHLLTATGLARTGLSDAYFVGTLLSGCLMPYGGTILDRIGARLLMVAASIGLATMLVFMSQVDRLAALLPWLSQAGSAWVALCIGFFGIRFFGQGLLTLVSRTMVGRWFHRHRGRATALMGVIISFSFSLSPRLLTAMTDTIGWRTSWLWLALAIGVGVTLVGWLLARDHPEECGLHMDGDAPVGDEDGEQTPRGPEYSRRQAVATLAFWAVTLALTSHGLVFTGVTFHIIDIGRELGMTTAESVAIFLPMAVVSTSTGYLVGLACDRFPVLWLTAGMCVLQIVGYASVMLMDRWWGMLLLIAGMGGGGGFFGPLSTVAMPNLFGRTHLGAIGGVLMSSLVIGSAIGPSLLAYGERWSGSYHAPLLVCLALPATVAVLALVAREPAADPDPDAAARG